LTKLLLPLLSAGFYPDGNSPGKYHRKWRKTEPPTKEETEYVESIVEDGNWLVAGWADHVLGLKAKGKSCDMQR
jgi:hypothetical protein